MASEDSGLRRARSAPGDSAALSPTRTLARYVVSARFEDLSDPVRHEARRTLLNWMACAIGGSRHEAVAIAIRALTPYAGPPRATVGRRERFDPLHAALFNGISSHVLDFDDTHLKTVIHPAGPVASAILALAEVQPTTGRDFLNALVLGVEVECRIGNAVYPAHYDIGWHITGTTGVFGAAAAAAKLLGLDEQHLLWAFGLAATQPVGLRDMFGTMTKSFHPGRAAQNGLTAAVLAAGGFTSAEASIEAKRGWAHVLSTERDLTQITKDLGKSYEILLNTYKPFACGIVLHPAIDGCIELRNRHQLAAEAIDSIALTVNPLVLELTGKRTPRTGLESKFSVYHACAVAIIEGAAGERQFSDHAAQDAQVIALRERVSATADAHMPPEAVRIDVQLRDGRQFETVVRHAIGSAQRPMTDADLEAKFAGLAEGIIPTERMRRVVELCWHLDALEDVAELARAAAGLPDEAASRATP
jgi:2-methylcitrate dehydratase PrpD